MPRKHKTKLKTLGRDQKGRYFRNLGWLRNELTGAVRQKKCYLGHDEDEAKFANSRLEALWACIERVHERDQAIESLFDAAGGRKEIQVEVSGNFLRLKKTPGGNIAPDRCIWSSLTLELAEAIRSSEPVARISDKNIPGYQSPLIRIELDVWLSKLREDFTSFILSLKTKSLARS
ncbi:hypothetical protein N9003_01300 [bacterium]|nr:hypothetical protein [bacterium]